MAVWLAVTGRARTAGLTVAFALLLVLGSWAVIGFAGLTGYPALLGKVQDQAGSSYSPTALFMALGFSSGVSKALSAALGAFFVGLAVHVARDPGRAKADRDRRALTASLAASLALTPVVWLHYFVVLLIPIALARPRFSAVWLALLATTALDLVGTFRASPDGDLAPLALVTAIWLGVVVWCLVSTPEVDSAAQSRDVSQLASRDGQASPASPGRQE